MPILKYNNSPVIIQTTGQSGNSEIDLLVQQLDSFEEEITILTDDLSRIDASINAYKNSISTTANNINEFGSIVSNLFDSNSASKTKGLFAFAALAVKEYGNISANKKKQQAKYAYNAAKEELLEEKIKVAQTKLPIVQNQLNKFRNSLARKFEELYNNEFSSFGLIEDQSIGVNVSIFKKALCLVIKCRFMDATLCYYIDEMTAWEKGKHNSKTKEPSIVRELEAEIQTWKGKLVKDDSSWDDYLSKIMSETHGEIPIPIAALLSDPCLFRNFIGINLGQANNCPTALVSLNKRLDFSKNPLVSSNAYYNHCLAIMKNHYNPPRKARPFGLVDLLVLLIIPCILLGLLVLIFAIESHTLWRIFFMVPALCWTGLGIEYLDTHQEKFFPYIKRANKYIKSLLIFRKEIAEYEDCQEVHILN